MKFTMISAIVSTLLITSPMVLADRNYSHDVDYDDYNEDYGRRNHIDYARVLDAQPIYETVSYSEPVQQCHMEQRVVSHRHRSSTPVLLGTIIGGAIGNELGHGQSNKKIGAVVGSILGGSIAGDIQHNHHRHGYRQVRNERVCTTVEKVSYREKMVGYNVRYKYKDRVYHTTMANNPGKRIRISVNINPIDD